MPLTCAIEVADPMSPLKVMVQDSQRGWGDEAGPGLSLRLSIKKKPPACGTLEPPQSASRQVPAVGHRPTDVG